MVTARTIEGIYNKVNADRIMYAYPSENICKTGHDSSHIQTTLSNFIPLDSLFTLNNIVGLQITTYMLTCYFSRNSGIRTVTTGLILTQQPQCTFIKAYIYSKKA